MTRFSNQVIFYDIQELDSCIELLTPDKLIKLLKSIDQLAIFILATTINTYIVIDLWRPPGLRGWFYNQTVWTKI